MAMRILGFAAATLVVASPAAAAPEIEQDSREASQALSKALDDPRTEQSIAAAMRALTDTLLDIKVGELKAIADGRPATEVDKNVRVRDLLNRDQPGAEAKLRRELESARPMLRRQAKALAAAIPSLAKNAEELGRSLERLGANIPDPTYPKR